MKKKFSVLTLGFYFAASFVIAQEKRVRLIVRGDDMGFTHAANEAIIKAYKEGIESSIEIIVPSPWFPEAARLLNANPNIDVGIHITFTSEWENVKYRPITYAPGLVDSSGYFFPRIWGNSNALLSSKWKIEDLEKEIRAQIDLAVRTIPRISHISAHMGSYTLSKEVAAITKRLAQEYHIDIDPIEFGVKEVGYIGGRKNTEEKVQSFIRMLESLQPGQTYLFVDHPGFDNPEMKAINRNGNVAADRQGVTDTWTDQRVKDVVKKLGIQLIGYRDLKM